MKTMAAAKNSNWIITYKFLKNKKCVDDESTHFFVLLIVQNMLSDNFFVLAINNSVVIDIAVFISEF